MESIHSTNSFSSMTPLPLFLATVAIMTFADATITVILIGEVQHYSIPVEPGSRSITCAVSPDWGSDISRTPTDILILLDFLLPVHVHLLTLGAALTVALEPFFWQDSIRVNPGYKLLPDKVM
ncbi:hypothetical protein AKJ16_DCAP27413 [Drosera capensis]